MSTTTLPSARMLPYGKPLIDEEDIAAVCRVLRSQWLTTGPAVEAFETALAAKVGAAHAIACANGTAALHLACLALGLGPGDAVIVPSITFAATANCARFVGAEVLFADVDPLSGLMEAEHVAAAASRAAALGLRAKAVLPVHFAGQVVDLDELGELAQRLGLVVIEDACHALGATTGPSEPSSAGRVGDCRASAMTVFSFHPVKAVTMGEGGAITTSDPLLARRLRHFRGHGITRSPGAFTDAAAGLDAAGRVNPWYYELADVGFNYRASDIQCALGLSQLGKLDAFVVARSRLAARYDRALASQALIAPLRRHFARPHAWHLYVALVDFATAGLDRAAMMRALQRQGIGSQVHYIPLHRQPYYRRRYGPLALPGADAFYRRCLSLPLFVGLEESDVDRIVMAMATLLQPARAA